MKVKDLTLEQIKNICNDHYPSCRKDGKRCPLYDKTISCDSIISVIRSALRHNHDALEEEIEISDPKEELALHVGKLALKYLGGSDNNE